LAPTLDIAASIDGRDVPRAEVLAWEARRAAKVQSVAARVPDGGARVGRSRVREKFGKKMHAFERFTAVESGRASTKTTSIEARIFPANPRSLALSSGRGGIRTPERRCRR
jgi:hypothetical protein